ncbi:MAG: helix-turn-helix transcriptional regulator [Verrucomicrobiota bacterium]|nr:helix-turn-helix transcriptional regulator [Verrucomicrobiota bacterium]
MHRHAAGLSQEQLAERADVHATYVGLVERGHRNPSLAVAARLASGVGAKLSDLIRETEQGRGR